MCRLPKYLWDALRQFSRQVKSRFAKAVTPPSGASEIDKYDEYATKIFSSNRQTTEEVWGPYTPPTKAWRGTLVEAQQHIQSILHQHTPARSISEDTHSPTVVAASPISQSATPESSQPTYPEVHTPTQQVRVTSAFDSTGKKLLGFNAKFNTRHEFEISTVTFDTPASKAGLKVHDIIISLNQEACTPDRFPQIKRTLQSEYPVYITLHRPLTTPVIPIGSLHTPPLPSPAHDTPERNDRYTLIYDMGNVHKN